MDILVALVVCLVAKALLLYLKRPKRRKKRTREPLPALLFGSWYYWFRANRATTDHQ